MAVAPDPVADHRKAVRLVQSLLALMEQEGEDNWIRGVRSVLSELRWSDAPDFQRATEAMCEASRTWRNMYQGAGSFSDVYFERETFDGRVEINQKFASLRDPLWDLFQKYH